MSILLVDPPEALGTAVARHLVGEGDEVRVLERRRSRYDAWRALGVHVAIGDPNDDDLVERAALNVRTVVLLEWENKADTETVVTAARRSDVGRAVLTQRKADARTLRVLDASGLDYVLLVVRRRLVGGALEPGTIARAVSAADDLAGEPHLVVDLTDPKAWEALRLPVPKS